MPVLSTNSLEDFISRYQVAGVIWKANRLLNGVEETSILRNDRVIEIGQMLALIPDNYATIRNDYTKKICDAHKLKVKTLEAIISKAKVRKEPKAKKEVRKNKTRIIENAKSFPFFHEVTKMVNGETVFDKIKVDKVKFIELLASFGFVRYEANDDNADYTFIQVKDNVISTVTRQNIIDYVVKFIRNEYDFEAAKYSHADADILINAFYDQIRILFSKDLFARLVLDGPLIINKDKATITYLYYKNTFVEITEKGYDVIPYTQMEGSVWDHQLKDREFKKMEDPLENASEEDQANGRTYKCVFADFMWKISGQDEQRFKALCCITGYLVHDFYSYILKMPYLTDSTISDTSNGRTGKTLFMKMVGEVRSFCEINGKSFNPHEEKRYETVKLGTQLIHINDVSSKGRNAFDVEPLFNDITEGLQVRALYMPPFKQHCKVVVSGNKSLNVHGDSFTDRILEFELSNFFNPKRRPVDYYKHWFARDWDKEEWNRFDNFICACAMLFHKHGLQEPPTINLNERKLRDHTPVEFIDFISEQIEKKKATTDPILEFDKKFLFDEFKKEYQDFNNPKFHQRTFNRWLSMLGTYRYEGKIDERKSNGVNYIKYPDTAQI